MSERVVRRAEVADAEVVGRLLHDFNTEFEEPTPDSRALAERVQQLLAGGETKILLGGTGPDGVAVLRFRSRSGQKRSSATWRSSTWLPSDAGRDSGGR